MPFNEGWGQFDAEKATKALRALDPTRLVDEASGWFDRGGGDVHSIHNYFYPLRIRPKARTVALSEYGGIAWPMPGHEPPRKTYGYGTVRSRAELTGRYRDLQLKTILPQLRKGLSALVYTQLTDVEDEVNGLFTYDRRASSPRPLPSGPSMRRWKRNLKRSYPDSKKTPGAGRPSEFFCILFRKNYWSLWVFLILEAGSFFMAAVSSA